MSLDPDELRQLKRDLTADDPGSREAAALRVLSVIDEAIVPLLTEAQLSDSSEVRLRSSDLLDKLRGQA